MNQARFKGVGIHWASKFLAVLVRLFTLSDIGEQLVAPSDNVKGIEATLVANPTEEIQAIVADGSLAGDAVRQREKHNEGTDSKI